MVTWGFFKGDLAGFGWTAFQEKEPKNPFSGESVAANEGQSIFRSECAMCHGPEAQGGLRGPSLTSARLTQGVSDATLFRIITRGVPGTPMPASNLEPQRTWKVITYLRSLAGHSSTVPLGSPLKGEELFYQKVQCSQCHMVNGRGGRLGPDLSRIGAARSPSYLAGKIRDPDKLGKEMTVGLWWELGQPLLYQTVTLLTKEGGYITGSLRNEDTFSIQLMDSKEELHSFWKKDLQKVIHERRSLMPGYGEQVLSERDLQDLLAYLNSLRGHDPTQTPPPGR
jgi:putative heme-binding domain-containing protein